MSEKIQLPPLHRERLPSGLEVVVVDRPGVPLVAVRLIVAAGSALDPGRGHGLANLVVQVARRGTARRSGTEIDEEIESLGAELGCAADEDASGFGLSAPSESLADLLDVVVDVATAPMFPMREFERVRRREVASIAHVLDEPGAVADRAMLRATYANHPYAHPPDGRRAHLAALRRRDLVEFHERWYGPEGAILVIVGRVDVAETLALARRKLARWRPRAAEAPPVPPGPTPVERRVLVVDKPDATQVQIRISLPALARSTPEYFPAIVANAVFGGGFTSRLVESIRVNRGLSYGVRSRFGMSRGGGIFFISSFTKTETAAELVQVALDEAARFADAGPLLEELRRAQSWLAGLHPLSLETQEQLAEKLADAWLYGFPLEQITEYAAGIRAVTPEQCTAIARSWFPVDGTGVIVAVGRAREVAKQLRAFGPVEVLPASRVV
jgi:zinc protease